MILLPILVIAGTLLGTELCVASLGATSTSDLIDASLLEVRTRRPGAKRYSVKVGPMYVPGYGSIQRKIQPTNQEIML